MKLDLLVEIGTEELPARFVDGGLGPESQEAAEKQLADLRLTYDRLEVKGTPRPAGAAGVRAARPVRRIRCGK